MKKMISAAKKIIFPALFFWVFFFCFMQTAMAATDDAPLRQIKETVDKILDVLSNPQYAPADQTEAKKKLIFSLVDDRFDFQEMSQRTLASNWRTINADERETFVNLFSKLLENTYIKKIEQYSDEKVLFGAQEIRGDRAVVESSVIRKDIETPIVYRLKLENGGKWMVYDVVIEGVSLVANYRSQFSGVIEREKFSGLTARLEKKIAELDE